jgi:hypothetical protein
MITATPIGYEIHDKAESDLLATITMVDSGASEITITTVVSPKNWPELAAVILSALTTMHPEEPKA